MMDKGIRIHTSELRDGMVISKDFIVNNLRLLSKDVEITERLATKIRRDYPEEYIEIYYPKASMLSSDKRETEESIKKAEEFFKRITLNSYELFSKIEKDEDPDINLIIKCIL